MQKIKDMKTKEFYDYLQTIKKSRRGILETVWIRYQYKDFAQNHLSDLKHQIKEKQNV